MFSKSVFSKNGDDPQQWTTYVHHFTKIFLYKPIANMTMERKSTKESIKT